METTHTFELIIRLLSYDELRKIITVNTEWLRIITSYLETRNKFSVNQIRLYLTVINDLRYRHREYLIRLSQNLEAIISNDNIREDNILEQYDLFGPFDQQPSDQVDQNDWIERAYNDDNYKKYRMTCAICSQNALMPTLLKYIVHWRIRTEYGLSIYFPTFTVICYRCHTNRLYDYLRGQSDYYNKRTPIPRMKYISLITYLEDICNPRRFRELDIDRSRK